MPKRVSQTPFAFLNALPAFLNAPHLTMLTPRLQNENTWSCSSREGAMIGYFFDPWSSPPNHPCRTTSVERQALVSARGPVPGCAVTSR